MGDHPEHQPDDALPWTSTLPSFLCIAPDQQHHQTRTSAPNQRLIIVGIQPHLILVWPKYILSLEDLRFPPMCAPKSALLTELLKQPLLNILLNQIRSFLSLFSNCSNI